ncbi:MAG TPA: alpha/beta fold hydrolase [Polyangia bacterium]|jgi:pimeloyl-ACP methyl ester carboxylesterase
MGARIGLWARATQLGRSLGDGVVDSGQAALYLRQLIRGNRAAPSIADRPSIGTAPGTPTPPVLLIHGYLATRGSVHLLERRLTEMNHVVMTFRLGPVHLGDIRDSATFIARKVESLITQTGVDKVDIVAHSMGGLVALDYVKRGGGWRNVRRLVLLGTPTQGTWSALLGLMTAPLGKAVRQLLPGSEFLRELERAPLPAGPEVITVAAGRDWLAPPRSTRIKGARRVDVATGHSGLLVDENVAETVAKILAAPCGEASSPGHDDEGGDEPDRPPGKIV